jgi:thioredoxin-dependent peroxiredoxin
MKNRCIFTLLFVLVSFGAFAQLNVGDEMPHFMAEDDQGKLWDSDDVYGKKTLVVYFYPAAMTGGCTKQACAFRDDKATLDGLDVVVVGVSGDEVENLKYFKEAYNLNFPLISDPNGTIAIQFGVPIKEGGSLVRKIDGSDVTLARGVTASRWTFIIDKSGKVIYRNSKVNAEKDSQEVISIIENL